MPGYTNFAVVGAGNIGTPIILELLNGKTAGKVDQVVILSRPASASKLEFLRELGATIVTIADYSVLSDVSKALTGIDVVITTLTDAALKLQVTIAEAAKKAGVQLFVPSEFGMPSDIAAEGVHAVKAEVNEKIRALGLPTALFFTGTFADWCWKPYISLDVKSGSVRVGGDGNAKISFTSCHDIGRYLTYVLTTLPPAEVNKRTFRIEGEQASFNEVFAAYERKHGVKLQVEYTPVQDLREKISENSNDIESELHLAWALGKGVVGSPLDNDVFPDWDPKPSIHYL